MKINLSKSSVSDKFLMLIGKKRAIQIPTEAYEKFGPYVYAQAVEVCRQAPRRSFQGRWLQENGKPVGTKKEV